MLTEVRDTLLALYERRNDFNADNQIVVDGYTNFVFRDLYGRVYSNHRINRQLKRITAKYNQEEHAEAEQEGREKNPLPPITCHMLRHTFCTRMILGGIDLKDSSDYHGARRCRNNHARLCKRDQSASPE